MEKIRLGKTNMLVNKLGFGGIPIQRVSENDVIDIVNALEEKGINFIDTARGYTVSENYLGKALKNKRDKFILATKSMSRTYLDMKRDIELSLKNLNTTYIDLYQFHNVKSMDEFNLIMSDNGAYKALKEAKDEGKVLHIGLTSHSYDFLMEIIEDFPFEAIQFPFNIVESSSYDLFLKAKENDIGTIVMKPLAGGAINNKKLAIKYLLNQEALDVIIPGMGSVVEVEENSSIKKEKLTIEEIKKLEEIRKDLGNDFCRRCGYCLPCTKGIDIPNCFMFEGYFNRYNLKDWARSRYNGLAHKASECIKCGACLKRCPYELDIIKKLEKVAKTFEGDNNG